jgi:hypothetical protein
VAWDRDQDVAHLYDCYRVTEQTAVLHAAAIKDRGDWIPVCWPHDGLQTEKGGGETLAYQYRKLGVRMLDVHATFADGGFSTEAGVQDMLTRMQTQRFKVAAHLSDWWEEFRLYHRENGRLVKTGDDLMSATRYALMMLHSARTQPDYSQSRIRQAEGTGADPLGLYGPATEHNVSSSGRSGTVWGNGRPEHLDRPWRDRTRTARGGDYDIFS